MKLTKSRSKDLFKILFGFAFAATFAFLALRLPNTTTAVSHSDFRPGNIISDYVMSKYDSMSVSEIQAFLDKKGNCNDRNTWRADNYPSYHYHIEDGHFVCLADERFALSGTDYGDSLDDDEASATAAEIIYQVAQEYKINPQALIVLLEKEQGLISDSWPNSRQYKVATGYGCPDTAPCNEKYYGFKNQLSKAAELFRTVLDGGWTNYPLGNNYIYYNPNSDCGGSTVNIENLATSALYRYTPYQPNDAALSVGYGTAPCGAYGNRNFFYLFVDWFGDPTEEGEICDIFCDMPEDETSQTAITWMYENGITKYYSRVGEFAPDAKVSVASLNLFLSRMSKLDDRINPENLSPDSGTNLTRATAVKALWDATSKPTLEENPFNDLPTDDGGRLATLWAHQQGITKYYSTPGEFAPKNNITRREVAIFLWRLAGQPEVDTSDFDEVFHDLAADDELGRAATLWAYQQGITKYYSTPGEFAPKNNITRREVAIFLWKYSDEPVVNLGKFSDLADLSAGEKYAINWAYSQGITKYYNPSEFAPAVEITRREIAIFLYRFYLSRPDSQ